MLGYLCSSLIRFVADGLNPSINFMGGDAKRFPIKSLPSEVGYLTQTAVEIRKEMCEVLETKREFNGETFRNVHNRLNFYHDLLEADIFVIHGLIDEMVLDSFNISGEERERIYSSINGNVSKYPHLTNSGIVKEEANQAREKISKKEITDKSYSEIVSDISDETESGLREISKSLEISPYTVAMIRHEHDLYTNDEREEAAGRLLSYYLGCAMGRWELEDLEPDETESSSSTAISRTT